jgi:hypothetical protein
VAAVAPVMEGAEGLMTTQPSASVGALAVRLTVPVNPPEGVRVRVPEVVDPGERVTAGALTARVKLAAGALATVRVREPVEVAKIVLPE